MRPCIIPNLMRISFLAAVAANGIIGRDNKLPWHLSNDLKRLKALTMGHHVIMGRKTFDEIGGKPLPGRPHVIISRSPIAPQENVVAVSSIEAALAAIPQSEEEVFILGGGDIFRQTLHRADRMYITQVHADVIGDTWFPEFDDVNEWRLTDREDFEADAKNDFPYSFLTYDRAGPEEHAIPEEG